MVKSKKIIFRVKPEMFEFVKDFSASVKMETSELMRTIVEHYFLMYFSNSNRTATYDDLKCQFLEMNPKSPSSLSGGLEQKIIPERKEAGND